MGIFRRAAARSEERFWSALRTEPGERRIDYAHLAIVFDSGERPGTAFLTDRRFIWMTPQGAVGLELRLQDCDGWAPPEARPDGLVVGFAPRAGAPAEPLLLCPQNPRSSANRQLARSFFGSMKSELGRIHPEWQAED